MPPSKARSLRNIAIPVRPASAPTASLCRTSVYDTFAAKLAQAVKTLKPAPGLEPGATQGPLIDDAAVEKVESHIRDAKSKGAKVLRRRQSPRPGWTILRADHPDRRHYANGRCSRGNLRTGRSAFPLQDGSGRHRAGQRYRVRPGGLFLWPRHCSRLAGRRSARVRHRRHQYRTDFDRSCPVRRRKGIRPRPRRIKVRHRRLRRNQISLLWRHQLLKFARAGELRSQD